jgi:hypothetical protein
MRGIEPEQGGILIQFSFSGSIPYYQIVYSLIWTNWMKMNGG